MSTVEDETIATDKKLKEQLLELTGIAQRAYADWARASYSSVMKTGEVDAAREAALVACLAVTQFFEQSLHVSLQVALEQRKPLRFDKVVEERRRWIDRYQTSYAHYHTHSIAADDADAFILALRSRDATNALPADRSADGGITPSGGG